MSDVINKVVPVEAIKPHPENYNIHPLDQIEGLEKSLGDLGQYRSVVLWEQSDGSYIQLAGHGVVEAMKSKGMSEVRADVHPPSLDPMKAKQILLADNLHAQKSEPNDKLLVQLLQEQQGIIDLASLGSSDESLRQILEALGDQWIGESERDEGEDELPEQVETRAKVGDVWSLGRHRIACINSCDPEQVKRFIGSTAISFVWADPPYGIDIVLASGYVGGGEEYGIPFGGAKNRTREEAKSKRIKASKYAHIIGDKTTDTAVTSVYLCLEMLPDATQIWWGANYYAHTLPSSSCWIVWDKEINGNFADAELAWCSDKSPVRIFKHMWNGMLKDSEHGQKRVHPSQKPVMLAEWCFEKYGKEQDIIFDPFLGSGMSIIAAENLGRIVYGCELSPEYIDVIITRYEAHTGQSAQLISRVEEETHV